MKKTTFVLTMASILTCSHSHAEVLAPRSAYTDPSPTSSQNAPAKLTLDGLDASGTSGTAMSTLPKEFLQMNPEQREALLKQARSLNNDQLQAIAKSFHQQLNPQDKTITTKAPASSNTAMGLGLATGATMATESATATAMPPPSKQKSIEELKREQAFNSLMEEVMPMSPEQIIKMHKYYDLTLQAKATPPVAPPAPQFISSVVNLEPGSTAPVIRLAAGFVTTILFVDSTGAPWPITAYSVGDPQNFNIQWNQKDNTLFIQSLKVYAHGNMAVRLWGLDTPVVLTLVSGQRTVDFRVDLQVGGRGPDAKPVVIDTAFGAKVNPLLMNLLDGVPPKGSIKLNVIGGLGDAWLYDNKVYFRSKLTILSPAWLSSVSSPDGTHVYELMLTPYIVATQNGRTVDIKLSGL